MKASLKNFLWSLGILAIVGTGVAWAVVTTLPKETTSGADYVYRFWSDNFRGHFFTIDYDEATKVKNTDSNWKYEKVAFSAYDSQVSDTIPLYRFWSDNFHGHFYTASYDEYMKVKNTDKNWVYEKVGYFVYPLSYNGNVETETVYRFWSPVFLHHFYTSDENEMNKVKNTDSNWTYEGPAFKVPKQEFGSTSCTKKCSEMISCQEAYWYLNELGCGDKDQDNDGIPCEEVCGG